MILVHWLLVRRFCFEKQIHHLRLFVVTVECCEARLQLEQGLTVDQIAECAQQQSWDAKQNCLHHELLSNCGRQVFLRGQSRLQTVSHCQYRRRKWELAQYYLEGNYMQKGIGITFNWRVATTATTKSLMCTTSQVWQKSIYKINFQQTIKVTIREQRALHTGLKHTLLSAWQGGVYRTALNLPAVVAIDVDLFWQLCLTKQSRSITYNTTRFIVDQFEMLIDLHPNFFISIPPMRFVQAAFRLGVVDHWLHLRSVSGSEKKSFHWNLFTPIKNSTNLLLFTAFQMR